MKFKMSYSKKFIFDLPVLKSSSIPLFFSSLRNATFDTSISNINYAERVAQIANILVGGQIDSGTLQKSTMSYISVEPAVIEIAGKYIPVSHT